MPISSRLHGLAYSILKDKPSRVYPWSASLREQLMKAGVSVSHVVYISSMFFWTLMVSIAASAVSITLFSLIFPILRLELPPLMAILAEGASPALAGSITFLIFQFYPKYKAGSRKSKIDKNLVYVTNYMNIISSTGATTEEVFLSLAKVGEVYGVEKSARAIIRDIEVLGLDILTALDMESKRSPSPDYADLLQGCLSTITTGGDIGAYLSAMAEQFLGSRKRFLTRMIEQLNLAGELYVAALVALPVIMITLLSIMGFFGGQLLGGLSPPQVMMLMVYVMVPMTAMVVLIFIDAIMSSW